MAKKSLVKSAAILAVAGVIVKVLGAFFRIPLTNMIGAQGMASYTPAYSLYAVLLVISTAGIPVAISRMVSERCAVGQYKEAERVFKVSRMLMFVIGAASAIFLFAASGRIAAYINIPGSELSMKATSLALLLVPILSSYRGYFQGMQNMRPTAITQIAEQVFRLTFGLGAAIILMRGNWFAGSFSPIERGAAGGCFGASAGSLSGLLVILLIYWLAKGSIKKKIKHDLNEEHESVGSILKTIIIIAIPITIGAAILPLANFIDAAIVNNRLIASGWTPDQAEDLYGQLTGMADPIMAFPQVFMQAIIVSIVPMVAAARRVGDLDELRNTVSLGFRMTTVIGMPCAVGLFVVAKPALLMLYPLQQESAAHAATCLQILAMGFVFLALITTMTGILQGIGKQVYPVINLSIGIVVKIIITWTLTAVTAININGAALGTMCAYIIAATLDFIAVKKFTGVKVDVKSTAIKPAVSALVMGVVVFFAYKGALIVLHSNSLSTLIAIIVGMIVYGLMVIKTKTIRREELLGISGGAKLAAICDKLRLW